MSRSFPAVLIVFLFSLFGAPTHSPQDKNKAPVKPPELTPRRPECAILLPERDERRDVARLVRADQFLDCERDGFPKHLAPPWKETEEGEKKLGDACEYFATKSAKEYPQLSQASLKLSADRCRINVMQIILMKMVEGLGQPPK
jgi:hypothetical protein